MIRLGGIILLKEDFNMKDNKYILRDEERLEPLGKGIYVIVSNEHTFNTDTVLLANFSYPKKNEKVIEFGSGCGAIPLIWAVKGTAFNVVGVEIQKSACDMFERSISYNNLDHCITSINSDLKELEGKLEAEGYNLIVCNPPYKPIANGILNENSDKCIARHEQQCNILDITKAASKLLKFGGRLCMCNRIERLIDAICAMKKSNIEPKKIRFVQQRTSKPPKLFLIEGKKGGKSGLLAIPTLLIEDEVGEYSKEMKIIYKEYGENKR